MTKIDFIRASVSNDNIRNAERLRPDLRLYLAIVQQNMRKNRMRIFEAEIQANVAENM